MEKQIRRRQIDQKNRHPDHTPFRTAAGRPRKVDQRNKRGMEDEQPARNRPAFEKGERAHGTDGIRREFALEGELFPSITPFSR